ncbi:hypothetical protein WICPIJ_007257 [Wickerhamomyces pijperi]|uniref:AB hydrolase-1 domain-containing protein n=1 Tax=Wickerhamomyces pijperi TaxID=599730 RepID=A0A9P8Q0Y0_WICPI|nr:hypothetical protein WICPIJ_007257 [Wickerhamomyces pijperi]
MRTPTNLLKSTHFKPTPKPNVKLDSQPSTPLSSTIFLHGYLGSRKTFTKLSRHLSNTLHCQTYSLDLRNHGDSFHGVDVGYQAMTSDLEEFIKYHHNEIGGKVNLVGYSMGAKVALNYAFKNQNMVDKVVCIDNAPVERYIPRDLFNDVLKAMRELEGLKGPLINAKTWRKAALAKAKPQLNNNDALSLYVLDNFKYSEELHQVRLKIPGYILTERTLDILGEFPEIPAEDIPMGNKVLLIKASKSGFIDAAAAERSKELITNVTLKEFEGSHHEVFIKNYKEIEALIEGFIGEK